MEVKIASLPEGEDPAQIIQKDPEAWKEILRKSLPAIEHFLLSVVREEKDGRKLGKLIEKRILPMIVLLTSSMERAHFVSLIAKKTGLREEIIWEDLKRAKAPEISGSVSSSSNIDVSKDEVEIASIRDRIEESLKEVALWKNDEKPDSPEFEALTKAEEELRQRLEVFLLEEKRGELRQRLVSGEETEDVLKEIQSIDKKIDDLRGKMV
jgi:DNA primase